MIKKKNNIPTNPGIYIFKRKDKILYIGKAKSLKKRVSQYFQRKNIKNIKNLLDQADELEYVITDDEKDALHLEFNLIRQHQPPFNIRLKDDKSFPLIEITLGEVSEIPFPGIYFTRTEKSDNFYLGPMASAYKTRELIDIVTRIFKLRTCSPQLFKRGTACLFYYIDRCSAPCINKIDQKEYQKQVTGAIQFLKGNKKRVLISLAEKMSQMAQKMHFEEAQKIKEDIEVLRHFSLESFISSTAKMDYDVFSLYHDPLDSLSVESIDCFVILFSVIQGRVKRREFFNFTAIGSCANEILKDFLVSFYSEKDIPKEILVQFLPSDREILEGIFSTKSGRKVKIKVPLKGKKRKILNLVNKNLNQYVSKNKYIYVAERLKKGLSLSNFPNQIEGYDISHLTERDRVGAVVVFEKGKSEKKKFRNYNIKEAGPGDTEALKEVLYRRFKKTKKFPDLLLIDGGKGQLSAALAIKKQLEITSDVVAIAKGEERVFLENGGSVVFKEDSPEQFLLQNIRDEVHRRAVSHHRKRRENF